jgi:glyoxylase-like metal-dependent hydrolase (beta-lactamase superfamily II)
MTRVSRGPVVALLLALPVVPALSGLPRPAVAADAPGAPAPDRSVVTRERSTADLAEGVYVIRHKDGPDTNPQGNTTVVVGDRDVLVIDSGYLPSSAREDIAQIREWTDKPVRYLVNTHWHPDHVRGNATYAEAYPGLSIIGHTATPDLEEGFDVPNLARYRARVGLLEARVKSGKGEDGKKLRDADRRAATEELAGRRAALREFDRYEPRYPHVTFSDAMTIDLGNRIVQLRYLGRGHSSGDVVAYLPRERVLVTGDLVASPVPYFFAGYPYEQIETLERLAAFDALAIVPGHGAPMQDKAFLQRTIDVMKDVRDQVVREVRRRGSISARLEDVRKSVNTEIYAQEFAGTDKENLEFFRESMDGLVKTLFEQVAK